MRSIPRREILIALLSHVSTGASALLQGQCDYFSAQDWKLSMKANKFIESCFPRVNTHSPTRLLARVAFRCVLPPTPRRRGLLSLSLFPSLSRSSSFKLVKLWWPKT